MRESVADYPDSRPNPGASRLPDAASKLFVALGIATGIIGARFLPATYSVRGKTVFITGGSRGLGLILAREFARHGAKVAISARDAEALERASNDLRRITDHIFTVETDITVREEADAALDQVRRKFGPIDVLVNNAGTICVGPLEVMTMDDYRDSINTHFWGPYFATMAVLEEMQRRRQGRIINISSIGGKISVPHLLPYCVGKFALTGFSQGLRSALLKDNVYVTTVCPGLMRTGNPRNALFKGDNEAEYAWFSTSDALPGLSMNAERAARRIVRACVRGEAEVVLSIPAKVAVKVDALMPGVIADVLALVNSLLPSADRSEKQVKTGKQSASDSPPSWITALNNRAAASNNQIT
jgi:NAD(P)-dependent dehydrogenase (short-subunit alcohol dehydrogenase family)